MIRADLIARFKPQAPASFCLVGMSESSSMKGISPAGMAGRGG